MTRRVSDPSRVIICGGPAYSSAVRASLRILLLLPPLAVGLVSFVIVRSQQGQGGTLVARQQSAEALTPAKVAAVVRVAPDPVTNAAGLSARCSSLGSGELHNPWRCTISYRSGRVIQYTVTLHANGAYVGGQEIVHYKGRTYSDTGKINGCCVVVP
jgi:hypothetical protein